MREACQIGELFSLNKKMELGENVHSLSKSVKMVKKRTRGLFYEKIDIYSCC